MYNNRSKLSTPLNSFRSLYILHIDPKLGNKFNEQERTEFSVIQSPSEVSVNY